MAKEKNPNEPISPNAKDNGFTARLDDLEKQIFNLKIAYEKYFNGIEKMEPVKDLEDLQRFVRDLQLQTINNTQQRYRFSQLRARLQTLELYWKRNVLLIEKGQHPKQKFRADLRSGDKRDQDALQRQKELRQQTESPAQQEDKAFRAVYDELIRARTQTGQNTNISFDAIRETLQKQSSTIKSQFQCDSVQFRVTIQDGKATMKAVPVKNK